MGGGRAAGGVAVVVGFVVDRWKCGGWIGRRSTWCIARVIRGSAVVVGDDCGG